MEADALNLPGIDRAECQVACELYEAIYECAVRLATGYHAAGRAESAVQWTMLAAYHAAWPGFFGRLGDLRLERLLREIGLKLPPAPAQSSASVNRVLHVLSEAHAVGGHTRLCQRWIAMDSAERRHSVVLTAPISRVPEEFCASVRQFGGGVFQLDPMAPFLERAARLRQLAYEHSDLVVLHTHMEDPLPVVAFAQDGGPRIILLNHAFHTFWLGGAVADLVIDLNEAAELATQTLRGLSQTAILPIPLEHKPTKPSEVTVLRSAARSRLGIPGNAVVFLTIGSDFKFSAIEGYDFLEVAKRILAGIPEARIVAVGLKNEGRWAAASSEMGGRFLPVGVTPDLAPFHAAADIYLEGFPCGSLTAFLEAGLAGLPCIKNPAYSPPLNRSDGIALNGLKSIPNVEAYVNEARRLATDGKARHHEGQLLRAAVERHHCDDGWRNLLRSSLAKLPTGHRSRDFTDRRLPEGERNFWVQMSRGKDNSGVFGHPTAEIFRRSETMRFLPEGGMDAMLRKELLGLAGSTKTRALTIARRWCYDAIAADGRLAGRQQDRTRMGRDLWACLRLAPLNRQWIALGARLVDVVLGTDIRGRFRGIISRLAALR